MANWHYYNENGEKITVTGGQLKWLAENGKITPETIVETEDGKSAPARRVKGLTFIESAPPKIAQPAEPETYGQEPHEQSPFATPAPEVTDTPITEPVKTTEPAMENPFAIPVPVDANPFFATAPETEKSAVENPFLAPVSHVPNPFATAAPIAENPFATVQPPAVQTTQTVPLPAGIACINCGNSITEHDVVCMSCGVRKPMPVEHQALCYRCGNSVELGSFFSIKKKCPKCGTRNPPNPPLLATVLFIISIFFFLPTAFAAGFCFEQSMRCLVTGRSDVAKTMSTIGYCLCIATIVIGGGICAFMILAMTLDF